MWCLYFCGLLFSRTSHPLCHQESFSCDFTSRLCCKDMFAETDTQLRNAPGRMLDLTRCLTSIEQNVVPQQVLVVGTCGGRPLGLLTHFLLCLDIRLVAVSLLVQVSCHQCILFGSQLAISAMGCLRTSATHGCKFFWSQHCWLRWVRFGSG